MNDATALAASAQLSRDALRKNGRPFQSDCAHQMAALPIVDFVTDDQMCMRCGGFASQRAVRVKCPACGGVFANDSIAPGVLPIHVNQKLGLCPGSGVKIAGSVSE